MSESFLISLIVGSVIAWFYYLDIRAAFGPQRMDARRDGLSLVVCILILLWLFKATVFAHPEGRIGWLAGLLLGAAVGFFDLRRMRIRNTPDGVLVWSSRIVTALLVVVSGVWMATHHGEHRISLEEASENPWAMFYGTTFIGYAIVCINGLYSGKRFASANASGKPVQSPDRTEYGSRRRGRR